MKSIILTILVFFAPISVADESRIGVSIDDDLGVRFKKVNDRHQYGAGLRYSESDLDFSFSTSNQEQVTVSLFYRRSISSKNKVVHSAEGDIAVSYGEEERYAGTLSIVNGEVVQGQSVRSSDYSTSYTAGVFYVVEYFADVNFSVEGKVGLEYRDTDSNSGDEGSFLRVPASAIAVNYYW